MTPGERFDQDEVLRFGDPWHGLFRNGVIELPNATTRAPAAAPSDGTSFIVQIPGQPAVTTATEDANQGMTWLNYGVITGDDHALYGRAMGNNAWIFIDADNVPWRAVLGGSTGSLSITLHRFGLFDHAAETYSESTSFSWISGQNMKVDDVDSAGRNAAVVFRNTDGDVERVFLLSLSGSGATFSIDISEETPDPLVVYSSTGFEDSVWESAFHKTDEDVITGPYLVDEYGALIGAPPGGTISKLVSIGPHYQNTYEYVVGATMIGDAFSLVTFVFSAEYAGNLTYDAGDLFNTDYYIGSLGAYFPPYHREWSVSGWLKLILNGVETEVESSWAGESWYLPPFEQESVDVSYQWTTYLSGYLVTHPTAPVTINGRAEPPPGDPEIYGNYSQWFSGNNWGPFIIKGARKSNRCYKADRFFICGPNGGVTSESEETDPSLTYATAHPISGNMVNNTSLVCWV